MKLRTGLLMLLLVMLQPLFAQQKKQTVFSSDIDNFWRAYDSCQTTSDSIKQLHFIQSLYVDKGTPGLKAFIEARDYSAAGWVNLIRTYPKFWRSVRPNTVRAKDKVAEIDQRIKKVRSIYPELKDATVYFTIGGLTSGGTLTDDMVLIGAEIATGNASTDVSEMPDKWLEGVFKHQEENNIVQLNIHEYIHTQQKGNPKYLLEQAINEGSCDFITELVMGKPLQNNYLVYGREHEQSIKERFKIDMFTLYTRNWLYNGGNTTTMADLGYFMGYAICKSYYQHASNKRAAVKQIIELDYSDTAAVEQFLAKAHYFHESINRQELIAAFSSRQPYVTRIEHLENTDSMSIVDPVVTEMKIHFSMPLNKKGYSINLGPRGKAYFPIVNTVGYSEDGTVFTVKLELKPNHEYEFILTDRGFRSLDGYRLKPLTVKFKTK